MSQIDEALAGAGTQLNAALKAGVENIAYWQTVTFHLYEKVVLPLDGFVFWVRADKLKGNSALYNKLYLNQKDAAYNAGGIDTPAPVFEAKCALHYATNLEQAEDETYSTNRVIFTAEDELKDLNALSPTTMYIAEVDGVQFSFSARGNFFQAAGLYHYEGNATFADMTTQILESYSPQQASKLIVSNSLPIWLSLNGLKREDWEVFANPVRLYPSFLLPLNLRPPFAAVHIEPGETAAIQASPFYDKTWGHIQLVRDTVRVTTYGLDNDGVFDFVDFMLEWTQNHPSVMGIMNSPVPRDEKRGQPEYQVIAQKKTITFEVDYYQSRARQIARQLIKEVVFGFFVDDIEFEQQVIPIP